LDNQTYERDNPQNRHLWFKHEDLVKTICSEPAGSARLSRHSAPAAGCLIDEVIAANTQKGFSFTSSPLQTVTCGANEWLRGISNLCSESGNTSIAYFGDVSIVSEESQPVAII
jgi:hypothetical protein